MSKIKKYSTPTYVAAYTIIGLIIGSVLWGGFNICKMVIRKVVQEELHKIELNIGEK